VTFRNSVTKMQINDFLIRANSRRLCKDYKVMSHELLGTQHRLLAMYVEIKSSKIKRGSVRDPRIRLWNLTRENVAKLSKKIKAERS